MSESTTPPAGGAPVVGATSPVTGRRATLLNQLVAIEKGVKTRAKDTETAMYQQLQRGSVDAALSGLIRTYQPVNDEDVRLPDERTQVQVTVGALLAEANAALARLFDVTASKDETNTLARGDIIVDGNVLVPGVPVTFLMTLEKELTDWRSLISKLPTLDVAETWTLDEDLNVFRAEPKRTTRTVKIPKVQVLYEATERHPAQVQAYNEDVVVGFWTTVKLSGAIPAGRKAGLLARVETLIAAVKQAREQANLTPVVDRNIGQVLAGYLIS